MAPEAQKHSHSTTVMADGQVWPPDFLRHYEAIQGPTSNCNEVDMRVLIKHNYAHPHTASHSKWESPIYCRAMWKAKWNLNPLKNTMKNLKSVLYIHDSLFGGSSGRLVAEHHQILLRFRSRAFSVLCANRFQSLSYFREQCVFF